MEPNWKAPSHLLLCMHRRRQIAMDSRDLPAPSRILPTPHKLQIQPPQLSPTVTLGVLIHTHLLDLRLAMPFQITTPLLRHQVRQHNITQRHTIQTQPSHLAQNPHTSRQSLAETLSTRPALLPAAPAPWPSNLHLPAMRNHLVTLCRLLHQSFTSR